MSLLLIYAKMVLFDLSKEPDGMARDGARCGRAFGRMRSAFSHSALPMKTIKKERYVVMKRKFLILIAVLMLLSCQMVLAESAVEELDPVSRIYTFTLNGDTYTLPCRVTDFTENGWDLGGGTLDANTYARTIGFHKGGSEYVTFEVMNDTEEDGVELAKLKVVSVKVEQSFADAEGNEFETLDGLHLGMTLDEVKALYGEPSTEKSSYIGYHFQEQYEIDTLRGLGDAYIGEDSLYLYKGSDSDIVNRIELQFFGIAKGEAAE